MSGGVCVCAVCPNRDDESNQVVTFESSNLLEQLVDLKKIIHYERRQAEITTTNWKDLTINLSIADRPLPGNLSRIT